MKYAIITAAILTVTGLWYYRRYYRDKQRYNNFPGKKFEIIDMEDLIEWFLYKKNHVGDLTGLSGVAVNVSGEGNIKKELKNIPAIAPQSKLENASYPVMILLGFFDKGKGEFDLRLEPVVFSAKSMTPILKNYFQDKSIIVFE